MEGRRQLGTSATRPTTAVAAAMSGSERLEAEAAVVGLANQGVEGVSVNHAAAQGSKRPTWGPRHWRANLLLDLVARNLLSQIRSLPQVGIRLLRWVV